MARILKALGLMSGTSMDGIDVAILETDGETIAALGPTRFSPYDDALRARLRQAWTLPQLYASTACCPRQ